jgi:hypothetical protein
VCMCVCARLCVSAIVTMEATFAVLGTRLRIGLSCGFLGLLGSNCKPGPHVDTSEDLFVGPSQLRSRCRSAYPVLRSMHTAD